MGQSSFWEFTIMPMITNSTNGERLLDWTVIPIYEMVLFSLLVHMSLGALPCFGRASTGIAHQSTQHPTHPSETTTVKDIIAANTDISILPKNDGDDAAPLPMWIRVFLRKNLIGLPAKGDPQYPRQAIDLLDWMQAHETISTAELRIRLRNLQEAVPEITKENERRSAYPRDWNVEIPAGTKLAELKQRLDQDFSILPATDLEDRTPIPIWFRVYLRKANPDLAKSGPYQYPRTAIRILQKMLDNPSSVDLPTSR
jgi:acyl-homoserine lactone acylase PvdQ